MGSLFRKGTPVVPVVLPDEKEHLRLLAEGVNNALRGLLNNTNSSALTKNAVSTTVSDKLAGPDSVILIMPTSLDAATALDQWRITTQTSGSFVIAHASTSTSDATLKYAIFG